jgi:transposase
MPIMSLKGNTMSIIAVSVTEKQFSDFIEPSLSKAKRGYVCRMGLYFVFNAILYKLHTGCQWAKLPMVSILGSGQRALSWWAIYYHFRKWKGVFNRAYHAVILVAPMTRCCLLLKTLRRELGSGV